MGSSKAIAGGLSAAVTVLAMYGLQQIPFIASMPEMEFAALNFVVGSGVGFALVYFAPANVPKP